MVVTSLENENDPQIWRYLGKGVVIVVTYQWLYIN